ncbi:alpha/beta hydrolase [uncultured Clostridium sp.]|uniref:alpha/beta hydrolase n=1 Tax=uncultured Clostridium sp. TaxID=59620 RepID=UPI0028EFEC17|nr:alpha/beta hydrolase [uncultured Clostridium sp.]
MKRKSKKILSTIAIFLCILVVVPVIIVNITPNFTALIVRKMFETPIATKPANYEEYKGKVSTVKDLTYESEYNLNKYDIYIPNDGKKDKYPTIIWVHGGAFVGGDKDQIEIYSTTLASKGYLVLSINYGLAPEAKYPVPLTQLGEFCKHLSTIKDKYPIDETQLFFAGDSAGAQIVSQFVITQTNENFAKKMNTQQIIPKESIKGALLYCGPYNFSEENLSIISFPMRFILSQVAWSYMGSRDFKNNEALTDMTIINNLTKDFPPCFITDGNTGSFESHGRELSEKLNEKNVKNTTLFFSKEDFITEHEYQFKMDTEPGRQAWNETIKFLSEHTD